MNQQKYLTQTKHLHAVSNDICQGGEIGKVNKQGAVVLWHLYLNENIFECFVILCPLLREKFSGDQTREIQFL